MTRYTRCLFIALALLLSLFNFGRPVQAKNMNGPMAAAWSPDGKQILVVIAKTEESWSLNILDVSSGKLTKIADDAYEAAWSPDGKQLVYSGRESNGFVVINADGSQPQKVGNDGYSPTWSPDGKVIRFVLYNSLATITVAKKEVQRITQQKGQNFVSYEWSPDQKQIAFSTFTDSGLTTVYLMNADGSNLRKVADSSRGGDVAWSPDGKYLVTATFCGKSEGLCIWQADGSAPQLIAKDGENQRWSPDGKQLAYVLGGRICVVNADGSDQQCLTKDATGTHPLWSPDGRQLLFIATIIETKDSDMNMTSKLNVINADGTGLRQMLP